MGRAPCCDKASVKKGPWSPEEDAKLKSYIEQHGTGGNWIALPQKIGLKRCGKSCRLRWLNYLRPNIKHGEFSEEEDNIICSLYITIGSRWSIIAAQLPGRTDNDIKNYWNTRLKKKLLGKQKNKDNINIGPQILHRRSTKQDQDVHGSFPAAIHNGAITTTISGNSYWTSSAVATSIGFLPVSSAATQTTISTMNGTNNEHVVADNDQEYSLRKLLLRLAGKFDEGLDNGSTQLPVPPAPPLYHHHQYDHQDLTTSSSLMVAQTQPNRISFAEDSVNSGTATSSYLPGLNGFSTTELDELFQCSSSSNSSNINHVKLESLDNFNIFGSFSSSASFLDESLNWCDQVSAAAAMCSPMMAASSSTSSSLQQQQQQEFSEDQPVHLGAY